MNIKKQTKEFLKTTQEYCNNNGDCNGCFFNIDMGSDGARCRLQELRDLYNKQSIERFKKSRAR